MAVSNIVLLFLLLVASNEIAVKLCILTVAVVISIDSFFCLIVDVETVVSKFAFDVSASISLRDVFAALLKFASLDRKYGVSFILAVVKAAVSLIDVAVPDVILVGIIF